MLLHIFGLAAFCGGILLLGGIGRRREKPWPRDGHTGSYFSSSFKGKARQ